MDWLAEKVLDALEKRGHLSASWLAEKREEYGSASRLTALRWVCHSLDDQNLAYAAQAIGVTVADLEATGRVLQQI